MHVSRLSLEVRVEPVTTSDYIGNGASRGWLLEQFAGSGPLSRIMHVLCVEDVHVRARACRTVTRFQISALIRSAVALSVLHVSCRKSPTTKKLPRSNCSVCLVRSPPVSFTAQELSLFFNWFVFHLEAVYYLGVHGRRYTQLWTIFHRCISKMQRHFCFCFKVLPHSVHRWLKPAAFRRTVSLFAHSPDK